MFEQNLFSLLWFRFFVFVNKCLCKSKTGSMAE